MVSNVYISSDLLARAIDTGTTLSAIMHGRSVVETSSVVCTSFC